MVEHSPKIFASQEKPRPPPPPPRHCNCLLHIEASWRGQNDRKDILSIAYHNYGFLPSGYVLMHYRIQAPSNLCPRAVSCTVPRFVLQNQRKERKKETKPKKTSSHHHYQHQQHHHHHIIITTTTTTNTTITIITIAVPYRGIRAEVTWTRLTSRRKNLHEVCIIVITIINIIITVITIVFIIIMHSFSSSSVRNQDID